MRQKIIKERIEKILYECDRHVLRIGEAVEDLKEFMPLDKNRYISLDKYKVQPLDQFLFRFSKLQDAIGLIQLIRNLSKLRYNTFKWTNYYQ